MSRGPDGNSAHISQDFHLLELAPSPLGGVAGVSSGQSLHPSGCGSYVAAEYTEPRGRASIVCPVVCRWYLAWRVLFLEEAEMDERPTETVNDGDPPEAEATQGRPCPSAGRAHA